MIFKIFGIPLTLVLLWNWENWGKLVGLCSTWASGSLGCLTCSRGCETTDLLGFTWCWSEIIPYFLIIIHFVFVLFFFVLFVCLFLCRAAVRTWIRPIFLQRLYNAFLSYSLFPSEVLFEILYNICNVIILDF